jgi:hypothetical protein
VRVWRAFEQSILVGVSSAVIYFGFFFFFFLDEALDEEGQQTELVALSCEIQYYRHKNTPAEPPAGRLETLTQRGA